MNVQRSGNSPEYSFFRPTRENQKPSTGQSLVDGQKSDQQVSFSNAAKALLDSESKEVQAKLDEIKARPAVQRTENDSEFLRKNDSRLAQITAKGARRQTAEDLDYLQKAGGFVNTMSNLSQGERNLYNKLVAEGNNEAAGALGLIALSRQGFGDVALPNGRSFDPKQTEITSKNIRELFSQMFIGTDGQSSQMFNALAAYLDTNPNAKI
ncbi:MAG: hypothetical protein EAZ11_05000 [Curvibacter sp.]|nr:MAG: hypothetical protein EAZ11_05000 [Curvibacter sp.]